MSRLKMAHRLLQLAGDIVSAEESVSCREERSMKAAGMPKNVDEFVKWAEQTAKNIANVSSVSLSNYQKLLPKLAKYKTVENEVEKVQRLIGDANSALSKAFEAMDEARETLNFYHVHEKVEFQKDVAERRKKTRKQRKGNSQ